MKKKLIYSEGVSGMRIELSLGDMFMANQMANRIESIINRNEEIAKYNKIPYDKRVDSDNNKIEQPVKLEFTPEELQNMLTVFEKLSRSIKSTLFEEVDENDLDDTEDKSWNEPDQYIP